MAVLEKIRKRTFFLILVIGLALFAFVISGVFDRGNGNIPTDVGSVNGDKIPYSVFSAQVENTNRNMGGASGIGSMYIVNMLWQQMVQGKILDQQFEKLGIIIGKDQVLAIIAQSPAITQDPQFQNANGAFDPNKFAQFIAALKTTNPAGYSQWQVQEQSLVESAKRDVYLSLVRAGLGATAAEGEMSYHQEADKVDIKYVTLPYSSIEDKDISISDEEIKNYVNKHKKDFEQKDMRNIQFVMLKEEASQADKDEIKASLSALNQPRVVYNKTTHSDETLLGFNKMEANKVPEFVNENSDVPYDSLYVSKERLPISVADQLYDMPIGDVFGPYEDGQTYKLSRMMNKVANAEVRASHILVAYEGSLPSNSSIVRSKEEAKTKAEDILAKVRAGEDFSKLASENSDDISNANNGGDLNFFSRGMMVPAFNNYVFSHKIGDVGLVETNFGFHIVKVTDQKEGVQLATIVRNIEPSDATRNEIFNKIAKFELDVTHNPTKFVELANEASLSVLPADNLQELSEDIPGLGANRGLVRWLFNKETKVGDVQRFDIKDGLVVAQLTKKIEKGLASVADARSVVAPILIKEKKAKQLAEKMKGNTLDEIANAIGQQNIRLGEGLTIKNPILIGEGREPNVVGVAFALEPNKLSKTIEGENGVYVIEVTKKETAPALPNYGSYANALRSMKLNRTAQDLFTALEESADIEDNRVLFY
ncbi:MAG: peptidylprolyl isomerase [Capnocytophaga sp.]|nr:peptidylprolyl isomerase [Capnocytophaga sp.]